jgi:hypothetical protein
MGSRVIQVSQIWRTNYLLPYRGCLNVHEKNMENILCYEKLSKFEQHFELVSRIVKLNLLTDKNTTWK